MAVTAAQFLEEFEPEFNRASVAKVDRALERAARMVNADVWADVADDGIKLLAAHFLDVGPGGGAGAVDPSEQRVGDDAGTFATTKYGLQYLALRNSIAAGPGVY